MEKLNIDKAEIYIYRNFLSEKECDEYRELIIKGKQPSRTTDPKTGKIEINDFRTSSTYHFSSSELDDKICKALNIDSSFGETLQGQHYDESQYFKLHTDYFEEKSAEYHLNCKNRGNRSYTFMIYLNEPEEGGETNFPLLNLSITPVKGTAIIWNNFKDGKPNYNTLHEGSPITKGTKTIITKWFRKSVENEKKQLHDIGFEVRRLDETLFSKINSFYEKNKDNFEDENAAKDYILNKNNNCPSSILHLPCELKTEIHNQLKAQHEEVFNVKINPTYVYGIRKYHRDTTLKEHVDRPITHVISSVINIDQKVDTPWPLKIYDYDGNPHYIMLKPGEILYYASNDLQHGRPIPFDGDYYCNIFVHYSLA